MPDGTLFRIVNFIAMEHLLSFALNLALFCQFQQLLPNAICDQVFGKIQVNTTGIDLEFLSPLWVGGKLLTQG